MDLDLTRGTAWLAVGLYVTAELSNSIGRRSAAPALARRLNSVGCAVFLAHVGCAFQFHHHWSHAAAHTETTRQTAAMFGWHWGGGLWVNYFFGLVWLAGVVWSWANPCAYERRPGWIRWSVRGLFLLMISNGAVIFARGPTRWFGVVLCLLLLWSWWPRRKPRAEGLLDKSG